MSEAAYERRREQVRRAQRSHRDRRTAYVRGLEQEIGELRTEIAAYRAGKSNRKQQDLYAAENTEVKVLEREVAELRAEKAAHLADRTIIEQLQAALHANNIELPQDIKIPDRRSLAASAEINSTTGTGQELRAYLPDASDMSYICENTQVFRRKALQQDHVERELPTQTLKSERSVHQDGFNSQQAAVDFVLALERPCLYHYAIPSNPDLIEQYQVGTGHAQMLSSPILARAPGVSLGPRYTHYSSGSKWEVPVAELENLLSLSQDLNLEDEVTPIQIWHHLRRLPQFDILSQTCLNHLRGKLLPRVKCYGFGAVIDKADLEEVWKTVFVEKRP